MPWLLPLLAWSTIALLCHEAGHALAARSASLRVNALQVGVGRPCARLGRVTIAPWPLGLGVVVDEGDLRRASTAWRAVLHAAGPAANLLLTGWLMSPWGHNVPAATLGAYVNLVLALSNLLPLPFLDGGWLLSLGVRAAVWRSFTDEVRWHRRLAVPVWTVAGAALLVLSWHGAL